MATTKLGLPTITGNQSADFPRDLNGLAEAVDSAAASEEAFASHAADKTKHITATERTNWNSKQDALPVENRRRITFGTAEPTGGADGDIYFQYE